MPPRRDRRRIGLLLPPSNMAQEAQAIMLACGNGLTLGIVDRLEA